MKRNLLSVLFVFVLLLYGQAQTSDSTIILTTTNGTVYHGKMLEDVKDVYIQMRATDNLVYTFTYGMVHEIKNKKGEMLFTQTISDSDRTLDHPDAGWDELLFTSNPKYADWNKAWLIKGTDTTMVKVEPHSNYCMPSANLRKFVFMKLETAYKNDTVKELVPADIPELVVNDRDAITRYMSLPDSARDELYMIVVDGKCKLLYNTENSPGLTSTIGSVAASMVPGDKVRKDKWYFYYNNYLYDWSEVGFFKKKCSMAFQECPILVEKIKNGNYTSKDVQKIVKEFNECIQ